MDASGVRVAIVGAGIAGLTTAAALGRAGIRCVVFEQATELAEVGAGIQLAPNASRLLHRLGLAGHLAMVAVRPQAIQMRRWDDGSVLMRSLLGQECERRYAAPYYSVHRAHLHGGLRQLVPDEAVRLGMRCVGADQHGAEVRLRFAGGTDHTADLVVAADGIHSVLRRQLAVDRPRFSGQLAYRGLVPADRLPHLVAEPTVSIWLGPGQHFVCYPIAGGDLVSFVATTPADGWRVESWHAEGSVAAMRAAYAEWHPEVRRIMSAAASVTRWALHDRDPLPRWSSGHLTLVGDAAHPMLPFGAQGASQGIEDGLALAACLAASLAAAGRGAGPAAVPAALARYEAVRRPRAAAVHQFVRANAKNHHYGAGDRQRRRDSAMRAGRGLGSHDWLFGYDAEQVALR